MYKIIYWYEGEEFPYAEYEKLEEAEKDFEKLTKDKSEIGNATYLELTDEFLDEIKVFSYLEAGL